jgi:hypothetical protein
MKSVYKFIAVLALLSALGATSFAQSARRTVIRIPFDFVVGEKTLPAGRYRIEPVGRDSYTTWEIRSTSRSDGAIVLTTAIGGGAAQSEPKLVFLKEGGTYVLAEVWPAGERAGRELARPRRHTDTQSANAGKRAPETVTVVMSAQE